MKRIAAAAALAVLAGCSTPGSVIPGPNNQYDVIGKGSTEDAAMSSALDTAESTCTKQHLRHVVLSRQTKYQGMAPEATNKAISTVAAIASSLTSSYVPSLARTDDYQVTMAFRCE